MSSADKEQHITPSHHYSIATNKPHKAAFDVWEIERLVILVVIILGAEVFIPVTGHILLEESHKIFEELVAALAQIKSLIEQPS